MRKEKARVLMALACATLMIAGNAAATGEPLILNGGFEDGTLHGGIYDRTYGGTWVDYEAGSGGYYVSCGGNDFAVTTTLPRSGDYSLEWSPLGWIGVGDCETTPSAAQLMYTTPLNAGEDYTAVADHITASGWVNVESLEAGVNLNVYMTDLADGNPWIIPAESPFEGGTPGWQHFSLTFPLEDLNQDHNAVWLFFAHTSADGAEGAIYLDDIEIYLGDPPDEEEITVPDVLDGAESTTIEAATAILEAAGLTVGALIQRWHETIPAGQVMGQSPAPGASVAQGAAVDLHVSGGPAPDMPVGGTVALGALILATTALGAGSVIRRSS